VHEVAPGEDGQIVRLRLEDPDLLAQYIGVVPLWSVCQKAASALELGPQSPPEVAAVHAAWCSGKSPRKLGPDRVAEFVDALRVYEVQYGLLDQPYLDAWAARLEGLGATRTAAFVREAADVYAARRLLAV